MAAEEAEKKKEEENFANTSIAARTLEACAVYISPEETLLKLRREKGREFALAARIGEGEIHPFSDEMLCRKEGGRGGRGRQ